MVVEQLLKQAAQIGACNVWIAGGMKSKAAVNGRIIELDYPDISEGEAEKLLFDVMNDRQQKAYRENKSVDFVLEIRAVGRFRVHIYERMGYPACSARVITNVSDLSDNGKLLEELGDIEQGLVVIAGRQGSGKSTTLAMLAEQLVSKRPIHLMTFEKPIERIIPNGLGIVSQREIDSDTCGYANVINDILHEAVDVLVIGELDSPQAAETAIQAAKMGCLVLTTINSAKASLVRQQLADMLNGYCKTDVRALEMLKAVIYQKLSYEENGASVKVEREIVR